MFGGAIYAAVFNVIVVLAVHQTEANDSGARPDFFNDVASVQRERESLSEFVDSEDAVVVSACRQNRFVSEKLHTERAGARDVSGVFGVHVVGDVFGIKTYVVGFARKELQPLSVAFRNTFASDGSYVILVCIHIHAVAVPVVVFDEFVGFAALEFCQFVRAPACGGCQSGVVVAGPQSRTGCRSLFARLVQILFYERKA